MARVFIGLGVVFIALVALISLLVAFLQSKKAKKLSEAQEKERRESLGDALYDSHQKMRVAAEDIRKFCNARNFGQWDSIGSSFLNIGGILDRINQFVDVHPKQSGNMYDIVRHLLPLIRKTMDEYDLCVANGSENASAIENLKIIDNCLFEVGATLDKKLGALFEGRAYDLQAELRVLESQKDDELKL